MVIFDVLFLSRPTSCGGWVNGDDGGSLSVFTEKLRLEMDGLAHVSYRCLHGHIYYKL